MSVLDRAKKRYALALDYWSDQRQAALDDIRFGRLGDQWPEDIKRKREKEGRPCLTNNRLPAFIKQVVNEGRMAKPAIRVSPVDSSSDPDTAEVLSGIVKHIEYIGDAESAYDGALDNAVTCGWGFFRVSIDYLYDDSFEYGIDIEPIINPLSVLPDPTTQKQYASDWKYAFVTEMISHDDYEAQYPGQDLSAWEGDFDDTWMTEDEIRVAEYWEVSEKEAVLYKLSNDVVMDSEQYMENQMLWENAGILPVQERKYKKRDVKQYILSGANVLETNDWPGCYIPIVPVYGEEVVEEGKRHFLSLIRQAKDAQRMHNYWQTMATETVALSPKAPFIGPVGAFDTDRDKWDTANRETWPYLEYDGSIPPQRTMPIQPAVAAAQEAMSADDNMKAIMGIYDASLGAQGNEISGKAIIARQRESDVSTYHFIDNLNRAIRYCGRIIVELIPKVMSAPQIAKVIGADGNVKDVLINQETMVNGSSKMYDLTTGRYDVTIDSGPSFATQREESREAMLELMKLNPQVGPLIGDLFARAQDFPQADELAKRLKAMLPKPILDMESDDGLPPEAQAKIAGLSQELDKVTQQLEQGAMNLKIALDRVRELETDNSNKKRELEIKAEEVAKKYQTKLIEIDADMRKAHLEEDATDRRLIVETAIDALKEQMNKIHCTVIELNERTIQ